VDAGQEGKEKFSRITIADREDCPIEEKRSAAANIGKMPADKRTMRGKNFLGRIGMM
jgi:hypothetical protein